MTLRIITKRNYGTDMLYVSPNNDSNVREAILMLTHKKTVDSNDLEALRLMGFVIVFDNH